MTGWRTIDTAPKDGTPVLLFSPDATDPQIFVGAFLQFEDEIGVIQAEEWCDAWNDNALIDADPTHWFPLPEKPLQ